MADRPLNKVSFTGVEKYDGTTTTINCAEERSGPDLVEQFSPEGSGATRTFYVEWADRFEFIENMVGFAKINAAGADGITGSFPDLSGWDGRHIHRRLPQGYHMGRLTAAGNPDNWVYATRAVVVPDGAKSNEATPDTSYIPKSTYAKIQVTFSALDYDLYTDAEIRNGTISAGQVGCLREWLRYSKIVQKPASIFFQYPSEALKLVDYPISGKEGLGPVGPKPYSKGVNVLDNIADFWLYIYDLPYDPIAAINTCFGKVNSTAIFATPDFTEGQPAESLHLVAADIMRQPLRCGRRYWNVQYGFRKVFNLDHTLTYRGHNYVRFTVKDNADVQRLRLYRISADGTSAMTAGNPLIDVIDFRKLFWIPASNVQPPAIPPGP